MAVITREARTQANYAWLSGLLFVAMIAAVPIAQALLVDTVPPVAQAAGLLVIPFSIFCWIFSTVRGLHVRGLYYWGMASTYVNLIMTFVIALCAIIINLFYPKGYADATPFLQNPFVLAVLLMYCGTIVWSFFYNARKTDSCIMGFTVTMIQTTLAFAVVALLFLKMDKHPDDERD